MKKVKVRYIYEIETLVPDDWEEDEIGEYLTNTGCADNTLDELVNYTRKVTGDGCLCNHFKAELIKD